MSAMTALEIRELRNILQSFFEKEYLDKVYPIGSIYISTIDTNPATLFGGTWTELEQGVFLVNASPDLRLGETGGQREHTHDGGNLGACMNLNTSSTYPYVYSLVTQAPENGWVPNRAGKGTAGDVMDRPVQQYATKVYGATGEASNTPPCLAVSMWKRIA